MDIDTILTTPSYNKNLNVSFSITNSDFINSGNKDITKTNVDTNNAFTINNNLNASDAKPPEQQPIQPQQTQQTQQTQPAQKRRIVPTSIN